MSEGFGVRQSSAAFLQAGAPAATGAAAAFGRFTFAALFLRFRYRLRRLAFNTLFDCFPINSALQS